MPAEQGSAERVEGPRPSGLDVRRLIRVAFSNTTIWRVKIEARAELLRWASIPGVEVGPSSAGVLAAIGVLVDRMASPLALSEARRIVEPWYRKKITEARG